jgi:predicted glycogen debranching enzyme
VGDSLLTFGREATRDPDVGDSREWLCTNGLGGFASGTVGGRLTRRYHGLLVAALAPPLGRTLLVAKTEDVAVHDGAAYPLSANRWADGTLDPRGDHAIESFRLDGTVPVWTYACGAARIERRVWMEHSANTTYVTYRMTRGEGPVALALRVLVNYRDYHALTRAGDWQMRVEPVAAGVRISAFDGARPLLVLTHHEGRPGFPGAAPSVGGIGGPVARPPMSAITPAHTWYHRFHLARDAERGLDFVEDHLHAATVAATLRAGDTLTLVLSAEAAPDLDGAAAWERQRAHTRHVLDDWRHGSAVAAGAPPWIDRLVLAADQFVVRRGGTSELDGVSVIAGYPWFGDWGRDTMISLPGLALVTGRPDIARRILTTFARFVDRGMLPNRFPDGGEAPEYNTVDAALWYVEAARAYDAATKDDATLATVFPALEAIVHGYRAGTRYGIAEDPRDHLIRAGEPGVQLTWMDARVGDWVVTPRMGKPVEINALWYNALRAMARLAARLGRPAGPWTALADDVARGFDRFWNGAAGCCFDVLDGPDGDDASVRPNQIFAVSLPESPLAPDRQRAVVDVCARRLATSYGLRSLAPDDPRYRGRYAGNPLERDGIYHQGAVWTFLLGPFALAHFRVHGDRAGALELLAPIAHHLADENVGSVSEIFSGDPPHAPCGCPAQAWSVAETLRAWSEITKASADHA